MEILHFKELRDTESVVTNAVYVFIYVASDTLPLYQILKQSTIVMEILHFKDLWIQQVSSRMQLF